MLTERTRGRGTGTAHPSISEGQHVPHELDHGDNEGAKCQRSKVEAEGKVGRFLHRSSQGFTGLSVGEGGEGAPPE